LAQSTKKKCREGMNLNYGIMTPQRVTADKLRENPGDKNEKHQPAELY
jgi:hypothetical protein